VGDHAPRPPAPRHAGGRRVKSLLFLKKKKQKDFYFWRSRKNPCHCLDRGSSGEIKVFWFFFSKKNYFLFFLYGTKGAAEMVKRVVAATALACILGCWITQADADAAYHFSDSSDAATTIVLNGHDLTIEQVIDIARHGAKVALTPQARQRSADAYGLLLEAATEGIPVYWFNRGAGQQREVNIFTGDPLSPQNKAIIADRQLKTFSRGEVEGYGPELESEDIVRAMMAVRANTMTYEAASPPLTQMLLDLLNNHITPVVESRGTLGEGDLAQMGEIGAAMVGLGDAYYKGERMAASAALQRAGLKPLQPFGADDAALISTDAYAVAQSVLLLADAREALDWADMIYAMDLNGMNSSVTPLSLPVQSNHPYPWLNWDAARVKNLIRGSYLFQDDPHRIIQDPESLRASSQRQGSAWQAWAALLADIQIAINASDHNPAVRPNVSPEDSWELSTPQMMKFYVKGGPESHGEHGYIFSNASWDPYPLANDLEAFTIAIANMDVAVMLRIERFTNPFFTVLRATDLVTPEQAFHAGGGYLPVDLWQEIEGLEVPVPPEGQAIVATVEDLQGQTRLKAARARQAVEDTFHLLSIDLRTGAFWMDLRHLQNPTRVFGDGPTAAWQAFRKIQPFTGLPAASASRTPPYDFLKATPARTFFPPNFPAALAMPYASASTAAPSP
jgi:histidine ammonia-lyase